MFMKAITVNTVSGSPRLNIYLISAMILVVLILVGFLANRAWQTPDTALVPSGMTTLSKSALEEQYGLHVNLVAVTAAGGLVDLRLKIVDGEKAKSLLQDPKNFPSLWVADGEVSLTVPEEERTQEIRFEDDGNLFLMFPNGQGVVKPDTPVSIRFGDIQVEPILAK